MNLKKTLIAAAMAAGVAFSGSASATGIPTIDIASLLENIIEYVSQLDQLNQAVTTVENQVQQIEQLQAQITQAKQSFEALNGIRDLGSLLNSDAYKDARAYLPQGWEATLRLSDDISSGRYSALRDAMLANKSGARIYSNRTELGVPDTEAAVMRLDEAETRAASLQTTAGATYERSTQRVDELQQMIDKINTTTDQKAALDLNTRIAAENVMLQNEAIRVAAQQQLAQSAEQQARNQATERALHLSHLPYDPSGAYDRALAEGAGR